MRGRDGRPAIERLVPELAPLDNASPLVSTFLRGLAIGALAGAALAGSVLLQRRRARDAETTAATDPAAKTDSEPDGE